jgi:hypothetical protein
VFARPSNASWRNARTSVDNTELMKVGTTMNRRMRLRGPAEMTSEMAMMHGGAWMEGVDAACYCQSRQSRVEVETATLVM